MVTFHFPQGSEIAESLPGFEVPAHIGHSQSGLTGRGWISCDWIAHMENKKPTGSPEPVLDIDVSFEEAIRRLATKKVPPDGLPDFKVRERRSTKKRPAP
jgi:hypothetical protein